ncbi:DUF4272 domain-containing protein [Carboxylicivirga marina]|uniref:DUF4272 domain-containing protein n=1 Tax=Carboxylicivirga marina TaxID=2800988 RepID=UPI002596D7BB|nr:DUF4272 domain-containing protein [uncultured Carboxylicivirga sp.]
MMRFFKKKVDKHKKPTSRKEFSENRLADLGILYNPNLPLTHETSDVIIRDSKEITSRIVVLWEVVNVASKFKGADRKESVKFLKDVDLWNCLSQKEKKFLSTTDHEKQRIIDLTWQTEILKVLYWSINEIPSLGEPIEDKSLVDISEMTFKKYPSLEKFINQTKIRTTEEILDEADFIYRLHWCSRNHRRKNQGVPSKYNYSVIRERDFAFRWITDPKENWDNITLDT